jgi:Tfp pilus assembly protein PilF
LAFKYFEDAIEKSPSWAPPYAGLADTYMVLRSYGDLEPGDAGRRAKATALKALELDDSLAEAHTSLATVHAYVEHDWKAAEREFRRAIQLKPSYATAHQWYGEFLSERGRLQEGLRELQTAETVDPLSLIVPASLGRSLYYARQYDKAIAQLRKTLGEEPDLRWANLFLARAYLKKEMFGEAIAILERTRSISESSESLGVLGFAYAAAGRRNDAIGVLERLKEISKERYVSPVDMALVYTGLGDEDTAFQ